MITVNNNSQQESKYRYTDGNGIWTTIRRLDNDNFRKLVEDDN